MKKCKLLREIYLISALVGPGEDYSSIEENINGQIIHNFTRNFTEIVLQELDTMKDFIEYLQKKEKFLIRQKKVLVLGGEEEMLAYYLCHNRSFDDFDKMDSVVFKGGFWAELQKTLEFIAKKKEDEISYAWDEIINRAYTSGNKEYELVARELARTNRLERRMLSKDFYEGHIKAHYAPTNLYHRIVTISDTTYCFVFSEDNSPREKRLAILVSDCFMARGFIQENKPIIGVATEMKIRPRCSYDFCIYTHPEWTSKDQAEAEKLRETTGFYKDFHRRYIPENEYPDV
jgi:hypothetical protein